MCIALTKENQKKLVKGGTVIKVYEHKETGDMM